MFGKLFQYGRVGRTLGRGTQARNGAIPGVLAKLEPNESLTSIGEKLPESAIWRPIVWEDTAVPISRAGSL